MATGHGDTAEDRSPSAIGPHASQIEVAKPYLFDDYIKDCMVNNGIDQVKENNVRLQGVAWLDSLRKKLQLPVRTFNTAAVYYHKFRLVHPETDFNYMDAAAAALFTACKIEDTLKKSKDILCTAYNLRVPSAEHLTPDDSLFENHSKVIMGLERLMLEASGFDFRNRYPQKLVIKLVRQLNLDRDAVGKTAYKISVDLYRNFTPLKQTTPNMAIACVELALRIYKKDLGVLTGQNGIDYEKLNSSREEVMGILLDLLDLYTHNRASTIVGQQHALDAFIAIRIDLNQEAKSMPQPEETDASDVKRRRVTNGGPHRRESASSPSDRIQDTAERRNSSNAGAHPATGLRGRPAQRSREGTVRFMLDAGRARDEKNAVAKYFIVEEEEYETWVDIDPRQNSRRGDD
ncbi:MAG: hypothetical protein M1825_000888 [Sarcosagium campestre]|nr:MAG: hypothetical protein M1825_000888 [Sarcosagium campestre]